VTFTRRAAGELQERLGRARGKGESLPRADTLHALAFEVWTRSWGEAPVILDEHGGRRVFAEANPGLAARGIGRAFAEAVLARERLVEPPAPEVGTSPAHNYAKQKESWNLADYTDLLVFWLEQIEAGIWANPYTHVLVDEVQDLTPLQLALVRALAPGGKGFFAIGDPDQSIYAFRGAAGAVEESFCSSWPDLAVIRLADNYRSSAGVLDLAAPLSSTREPLAARRDVPAEIHLFAAPGALTLDADLQNPLEDVPKLVAKLAEGYDVVGGWRQFRQDSWLRKLPSRVVNIVTSKVVGVELKDYGCMLRAYRREVVDAMASCQETSSFIPALANTYANRVLEVPVGHAQRHAQSFPEPWSYRGITYYKSQSQCSQTEDNAVKEDEHPERIRQR